MKRGNGKRLVRLWSERVEQSFAHVCDADEMRRKWLRSLIDVTKRYALAAKAPWADSAPTVRRWEAEATPALRAFAHFSLRPSANDSTKSCCVVLNSINDTY